jgi:hypothetical protein
MVERSPFCEQRLQDGIGKGLRVEDPLETVQHLPATPSCVFSYHECTSTACSVASWIPIDSSANPGFAYLRACALSGRGRGRKFRSLRAPESLSSRGAGPVSLSLRAPRTGQRSRKPGTEDRPPKGVGNSAPRETFRTGCRKARAESRFRWRTKRQPVRGTLSLFQPSLRAAVPVDAPLPVDVQVTLRDPADETAASWF